MNCLRYCGGSDVYNAVYMPATRTQIYLTAEQRIRLDAHGARTGLGLAEMIRLAVDEYLGTEGDVGAALEDTFGSLPNLVVASRDEWNRD